MNSKILLKHPRISVYEDDIILPNGDSSTYVHFGDTKDSVAIVAINDDGKVLVQKEYSYPPDEWLYQLPGGGVEGGEGPREAAIRELSEESDITGEMQPIGWYYTDNRRKKGKQYVYLATNISICAGRKDPEEEIENHWFSVKEIKTMIRSGDVVTESMLAAWALYTNYNN